MTLFDVENEVLTSNDLVVGDYRFFLSRDWNPNLPRVCWSMLNPSKATREVRDPTDKKVEKFTRAWGYGGYTIVNIAALQATDPDELRKHPDPVGRLNAQCFWTAVGAADLVVAAWGASYPLILADYVASVSAAMQAHGAKVLGLTKNGDPRHPLYMLDSSVPLAWERAA